MKLTLDPLQKIFTNENFSDLEQERLTTLITSILDFVQCFQEQMDKIFELSQRLNNIEKEPKQVMSGASAADLVRRAIETPKVSKNPFLESSERLSSDISQKPAVTLPSTHTTSPLLRRHSLAELGYDTVATPVAPPPAAAATYSTSPSILAAAQASRAIPSKPLSTHKNLSTFCMLYNTKLTTRQLQEQTIKIFAMGIPQYLFNGKTPSVDRATLSKNNTAIKAIKDFLGSVKIKNVAIIDFIMTYFNQGAILHIGNAISSPAFKKNASSQQNWGLIIDFCHLNPQHDNEIEICYIAYFDFNNQATTQEKEIAAEFSLPHAKLRESLTELSISYKLNFARVMLCETPTYSIRGKNALVLEQDFTNYLNALAPIQERMQQILTVLDAI